MIPEKPPLEIKFCAADSVDFQNAGSNVLRVLHFQNSLDGANFGLGIKELGSGLYIPPVSKFDAEIWSTPDESTESQELESYDERIRSLKISSDSYSFVRFICTEQSPDELVEKSDDQEVSELHELTYLAYKNLLEQISEGNLPKNIVRAWNFIPQILDHNLALKETDPLNSERYRQFNAGRKEAWLEHEDFDPQNPDSYRFRAPAATGIGSSGGPLIIEALLSDSDVVDISNPKQVEAYDYSKAHGSSPPMFSRATAQVFGERGLLFIAGTASIEGEDTKYTDDPIAQTHATFDNLQAIINHQNLSAFLPFKPKEIGLEDLEGVRVHIRDRKDLDKVKTTVELYLGKKEVCYVNDDICRDGLLVEIESNGTSI